MTLDIFTTQIAQGSQGHTKGAASAKAVHGLSLQGLNFFDLFLQNVAQALEEQKDGETQNTELKTPSQNPLFILTDETTSKETKLDVTDILETVESATDGFTITDAEAIDQALAENKDALNGAVIEITDIGTDIAQDTSLTLESDIAAIVTDPKAVPAEPTVQNALLIDDKKGKPALFQLQRFVQKLEKLMENESNALTALNITPEQITDLKAIAEDILERVHNGEKVRDIFDGEGTEENAENFAGIFGGLIQLLQPEAKRDIIGLGKTGQAFNPNLTPSNELAARLNNLTIGVNTENFSSPGTDGAEFDDFEQTLQQILKGGKSEKGADIGEILQNAGKGKSNGLAGMENAANNAQTSKLQGWPFSLNGSLFAPISYGESAYDEFGLPLASSTQTGSLSPLTSLVTHSQNAGQPHPGTQILAASIKKMAGSGDTKNIRIQLDPPELGRVEIKMAFNKDKTVKAILTAEKPETFMMMQRDAQILERALQEAGIDTDGSELSFELAQDDQDFSQDGGHDGSRNEARSGGNEEEEIIESTMTWHVDPETGHMRYNILA